MNNKTCLNIKIFQQSNLKLNKNFPYFQSSRTFTNSPHQALKSPSSRFTACTLTSVQLTSTSLSMIPSSILQLTLAYNIRPNRRSTNKLFREAANGDSLFPATQRVRRASLRRQVTLRVGIAASEPENAQCASSGLQRVQDAPVNSLLALTIAR